MNLVEFVYNFQTHTIFYNNDNNKTIFDRSAKEGCLKDEQKLCFKFTAFFNGIFSDEKMKPIENLVWVFSKFC
jgi:hypothetical protein